MAVAAALLLAMPGVGRSEAADGIAGVTVDGTQFRVTLKSGRVLDSMALIGAVLNVDLQGGAARRIRIVDVRKDPDDPDGEVFLHSLKVANASGHWTALCKPDPAGAAWAFPLRGQWDSEGRRTSKRGFTLTCASGAIGKCVRFGYRPWRTGAGGAALADYHAACVRAVRADYCGGHGTTRDGQPIDIYDALGIQRRDTTRPAEALPFEAAFSPSGAVCVAHTRVPANATLDALAANCPRLDGHLGRTACLEDAAVAGRYGSALIFIRSPQDERSTQPPQAGTPVSGPVGSSGRPNSSNLGD